MLLQNKIVITADPDNNNKKNYKSWNSWTVTVSSPTFINPTPYISCEYIEDENLFQPWCYLVNLMSKDSIVWIHLTPPYWLFQPIPWRKNPYEQKIKQKLWESAVWGTPYSDPVLPFEQKMDIHSPELFVRCVNKDKWSLPRITTIYTSRLEVKGVHTQV